MMTRGGKSIYRQLRGGKRGLFGVTGSDLDMGLLRAGRRLFSVLVFNKYTYFVYTPQLKIKHYNHCNMKFDRIKMALLNVPGPQAWFYTVLVL